MYIGKLRGPRHIRKNTFEVTLKFLVLQIFNPTSPVKFDMLGSNVNSSIKT